MLNEIAQEHPNDLFPGASAEVIIQVESRFGFLFPQQYREFLLGYNGALVGREAIYGIQTQKESGSSRSRVGDFRLVM